MQDKDFDRFIQQAFENQPEPEYNPADWDKLEDRLHNLNASQPTAGGTSAGAGLGKLGFVASAILVTALNVVMLTKPDLFKKAADPAESTAVQLNGLPEAASENARSEIAADHTRTEATSPEAIAAASQENGAGTAINGLPVVLPENTENKLAVIKPASVNNKNKTTAKVNGNNSRSAVAQWAWPMVAANRPVANPGNGGFVAGQPVATVHPCNLTVKPEIAAILVGEDTLRGSRIALSSCQLLEARIFTKGEGSGKITLTSNVGEVLPGARLITEPGSKATVLQWQPSPGMVRHQPYNFTLWVSDDRCPDAAPRPYSLALNVNPAFTAAINGLTRLNKGQETTLEVKGAPKGSVYQWLEGNKIIAENENGRLVTAPVATTTYRVLVSAPSGCAFTDTVRVEVLQDEMLAAGKSVPNIFTPNNDGLNDYFEVQLPEEGPYRLEVYDRDSKLVFAREKYDNKWNAPKLASGTYYYIITTPLEKKAYKGWVEIMR